MGLGGLGGGNVRFVVVGRRLLNGRSGLVNDLCFKMSNREMDLSTVSRQSLHKTVNR